MSDKMDPKEIEERMWLVNALIDKALDDFLEIQRTHYMNNFRDTAKFQSIFQTVKISVPMIDGEFKAALNVQKSHPFSFLVVNSGAIKELVYVVEPPMKEDVFTKDEVLQCKTPTEIHRSLANLRGLDLIIVYDTVLTNIEKHDIFSLYKPKLLVLIGICDG